MSGGEVHLEHDVEPMRTGQLERALEQSPRGAAVVPPEALPAGGRESLAGALGQSASGLPSSRL